MVAEAKAKLTKAQQKHIAQLYKDLADEAYKEATKIAGGTMVSEQMKHGYLMALHKRLESDVDFIIKDVEKTTKSTMQAIGEEVFKASADFAQDYGAGFIRGVASHVPSDIVESLVTGKIYKGNWEFSQALWKSGEKTKNDIYEVLAKGIAGQKPTIEIAQDLEKYLNPSALKPWDWKKVYPGVSTKVDYSAQRMARTLSQHAYQLNMAQTTKYNPFVTGIMWHSGHSNRTCELCEERDGTVYPKDAVPLDHPNGLCYFEAVIPDDPEKVADRIADWYDGNPDPYLDLWAIKGMGAKAPAGAVLMATNQIKALEAGKTIKASAVEKLIQKEAQEKAEKLALEKGVVEPSMLKVYKWSIKDKAYLETMHSVDDVKAFSNSAKMDFLKKNGVTGNMKKMSPDQLDGLIDDIVKKGQTMGAPEVFNMKEAQAIIASNNDADIMKFAISKGFVTDAGKSAFVNQIDANTYVKNLIKQKTKAPKVPKPKAFTAEQDKWLSNKGYTPENLPKDFSEWSHKLTSAEKTELFDGLGLHGTANPFQAIEKWYTDNIVTPAMYKAAQPKPLTAAQIKQMSKDAFSNMRKDNALWAKSTQEADDLLRETSGKVWRKAPKKEKDAIHDYTGSYHKFNEPLRGYNYGTGQYVGIDNVDLDTIGMSYGGHKRGEVKAQIEAMTKIIEKSNYDKDVWLQRGVNFQGMDNFFGVSMNDLMGLNQNTLASELLGKTVTDGGFFSTGVAKGKGFADKSIILNVYTPKGTKMMYAEPFSSFGHGAKRDWDGISKQTSFGYESEMIIQRGTSFRVTKVESAGGKLYVDMEVVAQQQF